MQNYYEILGVSTNATEQEIRTSYIEKIKKYHPDTFDGDKSFAEKQTSLITEAYTTLKDETLRKRYDLRNNISSTSPKQTSNPQPQQQKPSAKKKTEKAQKTKPQNEQKEDTIKTDKKTKKQQKEQEKPVQNDKNEAKKPKYTKKQLIEDIFIVVLSALLITILVLAIF